MPYEAKGKCVYKKSGKKVGCTKGNVHKYLAALYAAEGRSHDKKRKKSPGLADAR